MEKSNGIETMKIDRNITIQEMATLFATIFGKTDVPFYANVQMIIQKII